MRANILAIQVDVLFEEDKGFWVSVNTLRQNSKRPIVMTASGNKSASVHIYIRMFIYIRGRETPHKPCN